MARTLTEVRLFRTPERLINHPHAVTQNLITYLNQFDNSFPGKAASTELVDTLNQPPINLIKRMSEDEANGGHTILSHSIKTAQRVARMSDQLNTISQSVTGENIVDTPIAVTAAFLHDAAKVMHPEEIKQLGLNNINISDYSKMLRIKKDASESHMLGIIALVQSFGPQFELLASATAHSMHHIKGPFPIPIERALVMLADFESKGEGLNLNGRKNLQQFIDQSITHLKTKYPLPTEYESDYDLYAQFLFSFALLLESVGVNFNFRNSRGILRRTSRQLSFENLLSFFKDKDIQTLHERGATKKEIA